MTHRFKAYLGSLRQPDSPRGDLIADMLRDRALPDPETWEALWLRFDGREPFDGCRRVMRDIWRGYCKTR